MNEFKNNYNDLVTLKYRAEISLKRPGESFAIINSSITNFFLLKLKYTLDSALAIFPALASQFDDLLRKFTTWKEQCSVNLRILSRICDHLKNYLAMADHLTALNATNFNTFISGTPVNLKELHNPVK